MTATEQDRFPALKVDKWDQRFLNLAKHIAGWSKDPSTQTGAVIVRPDKTIASVGYNGFPRGANDSRTLYADRETKYDRIIHCEMNAILNAREPLKGYILYTYPFASCSRCAVHVIQAGISLVIANEIPEILKERWQKNIDKSLGYFKEAGVEVKIYPNISPRNQVLYSKGETN